MNIPQIISAAEVTGAEAIHPGYGFLAENAEFSEICERTDIVFVGPNPDQIRAMGDKATARRTMMDLGVPTVPGSDGVISDPDEAERVAAEIGFPVMIKASSGGGGRCTDREFSSSKPVAHFPYCVNICAFMVSP